MLVVLGGVLLAAAAVAVAVALFQRRKWHQLAAGQPATCADLRAEAATVAELGAGGGFRKACEVTGEARPGPDGPTTAPISGVTCVWHRQVVRRRFLRTTTDSKGNRRQQQRTELVSDVSSSLPFGLVDETGELTVSPEGAKVDRAERVHRNFSPDTTGASLSALGVTVRLGSGDGTVGYETEEWVLRPGAPLYVLGEAVEAGLGLRLGKPTGGRFLISTRTKAELTNSIRRVQRISMAVAAVAGLAGLVLLGVGLAG